MQSVNICRPGGGGGWVGGGVSKDLSGIQSNGGKGVSRRQ